MLPDQVSNPGPLTYESGALPIALRDPAILLVFDLERINQMVLAYFIYCLGALRTSIKITVC